MVGDGDAQSVVDALIVGGGPAGLSAAIYLARALRSVVLCDATRPGRSDWAQTNFNYLGFPDGISIVELTARGRRQAERFGARILDHEVTALARGSDGFVATVDGAPLRCRAVVLATGVADKWVPFPGHEAYIGRSMHWCVVCDGHEMAGQRVLVVGRTAEAAEMAVQMRRYAASVALLVEAGTEPMPQPALDALHRSGVPILLGAIASARARATGYFAAVTLADGTEIEVDHVFSLRGAVPNTKLAASLGVKLTAEGYIQVDTEAHTSVRGVFAAGDVTRLFSHQVITAAHEGAAAAMALDYLLFQADGGG